MWDCTYDQCVVSPTAPTPVACHHPIAVKTLYTFVIEDSPVIRQNLVSTLEDLTSVKVVGVADTEAEAVRVLSDLTLRVDLVIVDVVLREGTGLGVLRRPDLKRAGRHFVVLSNFATAEVRSRAMSSGCITGLRQVRRDRCVDRFLREPARAHQRAGRAGRRHRRLMVALRCATWCAT